MTGPLLHVRGRGPKKREPGGVETKKKKQYKPTPWPRLGRRSTIIGKKTATNRNHTLPHTCSTVVNRTAQPGVWPPMVPAPWTPGLVLVALVGHRVDFIIGVVVVFVIRFFYYYFFLSFLLSSLLLIYLDCTRDVGPQLWSHFIAFPSAEGDSAAKFHELYNIFDLKNKQKIWQSWQPQRSSAEGSPLSSSSSWAQKRQRPGQTNSLATLVLPCSDDE